MKSTALFFLHLLLVTFILSGCSEGDKTSGGLTSAVVKGTVGGTGYSSLDETAVLIRCNGRDLTKSAFEDIVALRKRVMVMIAPSSSKVKVENLGMVDLNMRSAITNAFPREAVLLLYAERFGVNASSNIIAYCRYNFMRSCKVKGKKWDKFLELFPNNLRGVIENRVASEALQMAAKADYLNKNRIKVSDDEIVAIQKKFESYNERCAATNALVWAKATNIWQQAASGADFADLAIEYDEDENHPSEGEWGEFKFEDMKDEPELAKASRKFRPGYVAPPIEGDNGLMIVKVNAVEDPLGGDPADANYIPSPDASFTLSRIYLHLPEFIEKTDEKSFKVHVQNSRDNVLFEEFIRKLLNEAKVEFPCGTRIFKTSGENQP